MLYEEKKYRIKGISPILGSISMDSDVYKKFIMSKAKTESEMFRAEEDSGDVPSKPEEDVAKATGFYRDKEGYPILKDYQVKGFLKEAAKCLKSQLHLCQTDSKIDNFVFVMTTDMRLMGKDGKAISKPDSFLERPLRAMTMQGPRVAIACSEKIDEWEIEVVIRVIKNEKTKSSVAIDMDIVEELLSYGALKGLLQWRNGGYGKFIFEEVK